MNKEKLAKLVNNSMLQATVANNEIELGRITKRLWTGIDKYITAKQEETK